MVILLIHNRYREPGGEDVVVAAERQLLEGHGHEVELLEADNDEIRGFTGRVRAALGVVYSPTAKASVAARIAKSGPDVVHVHNFFPLLSPAIYFACQESGVPVVQTLQNYRLICPNAQLLRDGHVCEDCLGKGIPWPGILHACYRGSRAGSAAVAAMIAFHRQTGTWANAVDAFIPPTEFGRNKLIEGGLPAEKIRVKPNFIPDPGGPGDGRGGFALFVGRLSPEKGIAILLSAWDRLDGVLPLKIVGDGPLRGRVISSATRGRVERLGAQPRGTILDLMREAAFLVFPSVWYEGMPMVIVEAFACGLPVVASKLGAMAEIIEHGRTGLHFRPGDAMDLAEKVEWARTHPAEMEAMGRAARAEYEAKYTPERNYQMLMEIYDRVTGGKFSAIAGQRGLKIKTTDAVEFSEKGKT